jgi:small subunit ribosomal protein S9
MLAARSNAFLRVDGALELRKVGVGVCGAEEDGLVLVHAGLSPALKLDRIQSSLTHIGKEQCRVLIGNGGGGGHEGVVVLLLEKVDECGPDLVGRPVALSKEALQSVAVASEASTNWLAVEDILTRRAGKPRADSVRSRGDRSRMLASSSQVCTLPKLLVQRQPSENCLLHPNQTMPRPPKPSTMAVQCLCKRRASFFPLQHRPDPSVEALEPSKKPISPSYYSGQPRLNDTLSDLNQALRLTRHTLMKADILTSYTASPAKQFAALGLPVEPLHSDWLGQASMSGQMGIQLSISQYRQTLKVLNALKALTPHVRLADSLGMPYSQGDMADALGSVIAPFRRSLAGSFSRAKDLSHRIDAQGRAYAVGRRKESAAQVWMVPVQAAREDEELPIGAILVNGKPLSKYFTSPTKRADVLRSFALTGNLGKYNVFALAKGGGQSGQADALKLAIAKALVVFEGDEARRTLRKGAIVPSSKGDGTDCGRREAADAGPEDGGAQKDGQAEGVLRFCAFVSISFWARRHEKQMHGSGGSAGLIGMHRGGRARCRSNSAWSFASHRNEPGRRCLLSCRSLDLDPVQRLERVQAAGSLAYSQRVTPEPQSKLYALYKIATASSLAPTAARPGLFDFAGRAKHDAWLAKGKELAASDEEDHAELARTLYVDLVRRLGWNTPREEGVGDGRHAERAKGMVSVSIMESAGVGETSTCVP